VRAIRVGNALRISQSADPKLRTNGIPRGAALARLPFERRLWAKGGPLQDCIIFDTLSKEDLHLESRLRPELGDGRWEMKGEAF
jgi:hypothetical protein